MSGHVKEFRREIWRGAPWKVTGWLTFSMPFAERFGTCMEGHLNPGLPHKSFIDNMLCCSLNERLLKQK